MTHQSYIHIISEAMARPNAASPGFVEHEVMEDLINYNNNNNNHYNIIIIIRDIPSQL